MTLSEAAKIRASWLSDWCRRPPVAYPGSFKALVFAKTILQLCGFEDMDLIYGRYVEAQRTIDFALEKGAKL